MITHFLSREQVTAYCKDFANRLSGLGQGAPFVWCPIGKSGIAILKIILDVVPEDLRAKILIQPLSYRKPANGSAGEVSVIPAKGKTEQEALEDLKRALAVSPNALVLDSSVHSGSSMLGALRLLESIGAKNSQTYALVIKQTSGFIPHYFGLVVGDHDRTLFLLDEIPNNRLAKPNTSFLGVMRRLTKEDVHSPEKLDTGVDSISKIGWGDLWYDTNVHGFQVYIVEAGGKLAGFVKYKIEPLRRLVLDVIAVDRSFQGQGIGAALFRWAETIARSSSCASIDLWGVENQVATYENAGYSGSGEWIDTGGGEKYQFMSKPLLYHFDLKEMMGR